jgi:hypothetical protein
MKKHFLSIVACSSLLIAFSVLTSAAESPKKNSVVETISNPVYQIIDNEIFASKYSNMNWMHIARLQNINPDFDLHSIDQNTDWSLVVFNHDDTKSFAYRLYDGRFLIILVK